MIEEVQRLGDSDHLVRIAPEMDVPLTDRITAILDTATMRRLGRLSQLGLVAMVYPGATHSRLEHSLGVYRNALWLLRYLGRREGFAEIVNVRGAEAFVLAALLHDAGHWPFCHAIEDMRLPGLERHEQRVAEVLKQSEMAELIGRDWSCTDDDIQSLLEGRPVGETRLGNDAISLLASCLSGPIDVDKLDYLIRDSHHAGVPYGRNFDAARLMGAVTIHPGRPRLAITDKGRTAAEMMVFARYVMFSEVYWHHAVRAATAMLQRAVFETVTGKAAGDADARCFTTLGFSDEQWIQWLIERSQNAPVFPLLDGLFGSRRRLYKRVLELNVVDGNRLHRALARRSYWWLVACGDTLASRLSQLTGLKIGGTDLLIDAPPVKLEVDINMDVVDRGGIVRKLAEVSPVADALANQQFDDHVKRVRIFVRPEFREPIQRCLSDESVLWSAIEATAQDVV